MHELPLDPLTALALAPVSLRSMGWLLDGVGISTAGITGKLRTTSWEDDKQVKRYRTNIIVDDLVLLDGASNRPPEPPTEAYEGQF